MAISSGGDDRQQAVGPGRRGKLEEEPRTLQAREFRELGEEPFFLGQPFCGVGGGVGGSAQGCTEDAHAVLRVRLFIYLLN